MLEISPQKWLVRFVRICVGSLSAMGDKNRLPGVNFLHDAGTGEEEMIDAELIGDLVFFSEHCIQFQTLDFIDKNLPHTWTLECSLAFPIAAHCFVYLLPSWENETLGK